MHEYEKLFDKWGDLGEKVYSLQGIVQNPVEIPEEQIKEWRDIAAKLWLEFRDLTEVTLHELRKNKTYDVYVHPESGATWIEEAIDTKRQEYLITRNDGCVEIFKRDLNRPEALDVVKDLVDNKGYEFNS